MHVTLKGDIRLETSTPKVLWGRGGVAGGENKDLKRCN